MLDFKEYISELTALTSGKSLITDRVQVDGHNAYVITRSNGDVFDVADDGSYLPLKTTNGPGGENQFDYLDWNADLKIPGAPPASLIVDPNLFKS